MPDECPQHDCPKCGIRMTDRQCLTCKKRSGKPVTVRFCSLCDGGPMEITDSEIVDHVKNMIEGYWKKKQIN